jgi:putative ABC transport system permease protein
MAYAVAQRLHEIGIRLALGADAPAVVRLVLRGGLLPAALGWIAGLAGALAVGRLMEAMLWGVTPTDPPSILLVSVTIISVTLLAAYFPARRAARIPPTLALRGE